MVLQVPILPTPDDLLIVVPARGGSKRLPGKNLAQLGGKPLIAHTAEFINSEGLRNHSIVSTDDPLIASTAVAFGLNAPFLRPAAISGDNAPSLAVVMHALEWHAREHGGRRAPLVAVLQPTSPLRRAHLLRDALVILQASGGCNSVVGMRRLHVPGSYIFTRRETGEVGPVTQDAATVYEPTGSLYLGRTCQIAAQNTLYAAPVHMIEIAAIDAIDVDFEEDLWLADAAMAIKIAQARRNEHLPEATRAQRHDGRVVAQGSNQDRADLPIAAPTRSRS